MPKKSDEQSKRVNVSTTLIYSQENKSVQDILLKSFALFLEQEANQRYNKEDERKLCGGTSCTQQ